MKGLFAVGAFVVAEILVRVAHMTIQHLNTLVDSTAEITDTLLVVAGVKALVIKHETPVVETLAAKLTGKAGRPVFLAHMLLQRAALDKAVALRAWLLLCVAVHPLPMVVQAAGKLEVHATLVTEDIASSTSARPSILFLTATHRAVLALNKGQAGQLINGFPMTLHHMGEKILLKVERFPAVTALEIFCRRLRLFASFRTTTPAVSLVAYRGIQVIKQTVQKVIVILMGRLFDLWGCDGTAQVLRLLSQVDLRLQLDMIERLLHRLHLGLLGGAAVLGILLILLLLLLAMLLDMFV